MSVEYYSNRLARDTETIEDLAIIPKTIVEGLPLPADKPMRPGSGLFVVRVFDCQGKRAPGISVSVTPAPADLVVAYTEGSAAPRFDLSETTVSGEAGLINLTPGVAMTVTATISPTKSIRYQLVAEGGRASTLELYPGIFSSTK